MARGNLAASPVRRGRLPGAAKAGELTRAEEIFARLAAANPEPKSELEYVNTFTLLVAVVLSAQATDAGVNKATRALFASADAPAKMAALGEAELAERIKTIGLYRTKAKNVIALSQALIRDHGGEVPADRDALEALPGVGRKTASVVLNELGVEPAIAVDTHVFRVSHRLGLANASTPDKVERQLFQVGHVLLILRRQIGGHQRIRIGGGIADDPGIHAHQQAGQNGTPDLCVLFL